MTLASGTALCAIERARQSDLANIRWLLNLEGLSSADITEDLLEHFLVYRDAIGVAGVVGLERFGDVSLLRSLVVAEGHLRRGLGKRLVGAAEELPRELGVRAIYLPTTTAELYFEALGFHRAKRENAPPAIEHCSQFQSLCPSSAVLMVKP
jgi:amino-acid N-acetyltransferase